MWYDEKGTSPVWPFPPESVCISSSNYEKTYRFWRKGPHRWSTLLIISHQLSSVQSSCSVVSDSAMNHSTPGLPVHHHLPEFTQTNSSHEVAKVLEFQLYHRSFQRNPRADLLQNGLVGSPCSPRDSQESSPTPQFKSINFSAISFLHSPTVTSIHDHWKNHSLA